MVAHARCSEVPCPNLLQPYRNLFEARVSPHGVLGGGDPDSERISRLSKGR